MLGNAARFAGDHIGLAQRIQQRGFSMIHMAHDGNDRRARRERMRWVIQLDEMLLDIRIRHALGFMPHGFDDNFGRIGIN